MFSARFRTPCANGCGEYIKPGQIIVMTDDGAAHAECRIEEADRPVQVCDKCNLARPCEHDE